MRCEAQQQGCPAEELRDAKTALQLQNAIRAIKAPADEDLGDPIPPIVAPLIPRWKAALLQVARDVIRCDTTQPANQMEAELASLLRANPPQPAEGAVTKDDPGYTEWEQFTYGHNLLVHVKDAAPDLLTVEFSFHITCGDDTVWLVFQRDGTRWKEKLDWYAKPYKDIGGAFGDGLFTAFLPGSTPGDWRAVVVHGHPWCTSRFSSFDIDVLAPSTDPAQPRVVWHTTRDYSRGDYPEKLRAAGDTFEFRTNVPALSADEYERTVIYRNRVSGNQVQRIEPIATDGRGFVDEWLNSPWPEASARTAEASQAALRRVFDLYNTREAENSRTFTDWSNGPVRACPEKTYQVEIDSTRNTIVPGKPGGDSQSLPPVFFRIRETGNGYQMMNVTTAPSPECTGPNLIPLQK